MASTVAANKLKVTIKEEIYLKGKNQGAVTELSISDINEISNRIITIPTTVKTIITLSSAVAGGTYIRDNIKYIRVTNLDNTNYVIIGALDTGADTFYIKLDAGKSFLMGNGVLEAFIDGSVHAAWADIDSITAQAHTAACDLEIFIASV